MKKRFVSLFLSVVLLGGASRPAGAEKPRVAIEANTSFWYLLSEQVENGLLQQGSLDRADDRASGFNFKQGRLAFSLESPRRRIAAFIRLRLEERTDVIDFWGRYRAFPWLDLVIGQMKIPSTGEVLTEDSRLDFITRTTFGQKVGDYSLSRTPYISSVMAVKSYDRDLGIALRGGCPAGKTPSFSFFLMVGNGIGANRYIGGRESEEFIYTNSFGDYYYGLRLEAVPREELRLGAHISRNEHDDMSLGNRGPVIDIDRRILTADLAARLPWRQRVYLFYGEGQIIDFMEGLPYRFDYSGWGAWTVQPLLEDRLELALRYDLLTTEYYRNDQKTDQRNWTVGINYQPEPYLRLQLNYIYKKTIDDFDPDLDDNILCLNFKFLFDAVLASP